MILEPEVLLSYRKQLFECMEEGDLKNALELAPNLSSGRVAGIALGCNVLIAGIIGGTLPFIIKRFGGDPALMTGPVLTTITDITGVSIYLGLSTLFLASLIG